MQSKVFNKHSANKNNKKSFIQGETSVQPKLQIGTSNDYYEQEADRVADAVVRKNEVRPVKNTVKPIVQKKCAACSEEERIQKKPISTKITPLVQRSTKTNSSAEVSPQINNKINETKGSGDSMNNETKDFMESRFDQNFSEVNIHTDDNAANLNNELNARAFTVGNDIYFNHGQYQPNTASGKHLLAHELTHTVQQNGTEKLIQQKSNSKTNKGTEKTITVNRLVFSSKLKRITFALDDKVLATISTTYDGQPNPGVYYYKDGQLDPTDRQKMGGKGDENGDIISWISGNVIIEKTSDFSLTVIDDRLMHGEGSGKLSMLDFGQLTNLSKDLSDEDFRRLREGGIADSLEKAANSLKNYKRQLKQEEIFNLEAASVENRFFGLETVYKMYQVYNCQNKYPGHMAGFCALQSKLKEGLEYSFIDLIYKLKLNGFNGISEFEEYIARFEDNFENQTVILAENLLRGYQEKLESAIVRYKNKKERISLHKELKSSRKLNQEYEEAQHNYDFSKLPYSKKSSLEQHSLKERARAKKDRRNKAYSDVAENHSIIMRFDPSEMLDKNKRYFTGDEFRRDLLKRNADIKSTREALRKRKDYIYKEEFDILMQIAYQQKGIKEDSIFDLIIKDKQKKVEEDESFVEDVLTAASIALMIVTFGGSGVAVALAEAGLAAIGTVSAVYAIDDYLHNDQAYKAGLSSNEPSVFWVAVAVVGAGVDLGSAAVAFSRLAKYGGKLNDPEELSKILDSEDLVPKKSMSIEEYNAVNAKLKSAVLKRQKAQLQLDNVFKSAMKEINGKVSSNPFLDPMVAVHISKLIKECIKYGYYRFNEFLLILKRNGLERKLTKSEENLLKRMHDKELDESIAYKQQLLESNNMTDELGIEGLPELSEYQKVDELTDGYRIIEPQSSGNLEAARRGIAEHSMIAKAMRPYEGKLHGEGWRLDKVERTVGGSKRIDELWINDSKKRIIVVDTYTGKVESLSHLKKGWAYSNQQYINEFIKRGYEYGYSVAIKHPDLLH